MVFKTFSSLIIALVLSGSLSGQQAQKKEISANQVIEMIVTNVALSLGAPGFSTHLKLLQEKNTDLLIAGESPEWETYQYVYDAQLQGKNKAVIFLGHTNSEEAGMEYCAKWLKGFIPAGIPIQYIKNGSSFKTL
jgi:putative NIF3 family GTP cyclohydrolase 1 type 2